MIAIYLSAMVIANLTVHWFGPAVTPLNALLLIGLDLSLRDRLQEKYGLYASLGLVLPSRARVTLKWRKPFFIRGQAHLRKVSLKHIAYLQCYF
jgi:hypothetical protein